MGVLGNFQHEKFCQEYHKLLWSGGKPKDSRVAAYKAAGFDAEQQYIADNARKLANRKDVKGRLTELSEYAATMAGIDAGWAMLVLKRRVDLIDDFNIDDYLTPATEELPRRHLDISKCDKDQLRRLAEVSIKDGEFKIKGYGDLAGPLGLMAKIAGWLAPEKQQHDIGGATLEALVTKSYEKPKEPQAA